MAQPIRRIMLLRVCCKWGTSKDALPIRTAKKHKVLLPALPDEILVGFIFPAVIKLNLENEQLEKTIDIALVNKKWSEIVLPLLWNSISLNSKQFERFTHCLNNNNGQLIRHLVLGSDRLKVVVTDYSVSHTGEDLWDSRPEPDVLAKVDRLLAAVDKHCSLLVDLEVGHCLNGEQIEVISSSGYMTNLRSLTLSQRATFNDYYAPECKFTGMLNSPKLTQLVFGIDSINSESWKHLLPQLPNLKVFKVNQVVFWMDDEILKLIQANCPKIIILVFDAETTMSASKYDYNERACPKFTEAAVVELLQQCKSLKMFDTFLGLFSEGLQQRIRALPKK